MDQSDLLSEVFSTLRIRSDLYFLAELGGDFSVEVPKERRRIRFHLLRHGCCWCRVPGCAPIMLNEGDLAIIPDGKAQIISAAPEGRAVPLEAAIAGGSLDRGVLRYGKGAPQARLVCGFCRFDEEIEHPILSALPTVLVIRAAELGAEPWTALALRLLSMEADLKEQGTTAVLSRLLEIVFIQAVRRITLDSEGHSSGFVAALSDRRLVEALDAIHGAADVAWNVRDLAKRAGMSRARFSEHFTKTLGMPPITYLTNWRLIKARGLLASSTLGMAEIAERCGYASVPSFSRRFKQNFGVGPGAFRRSSTRTE